MRKPLHIAADQIINFSGTSADGKATGFFPVRVVDPHSNAAKITHVRTEGKRDREYEGAFLHQRLATVESLRTGKRFEAFHFTLGAQRMG